MVNVIKKFRHEFVLGGLLLLAYVPTFFWMKVRWFARDSYYSHGVLIPFVIAYIIWQDRKKIAAVFKKNALPSSRETAIGLTLVASSVAIHIASSAFRVFFTSGFSFLTCLIGVLLVIGGLPLLRVLKFPLFFLVFMLPLPSVAITNISFKMKMFAASLSAKMINRIGILAVREGSIIRMPHAYVVVDDVCSGLRSLISLMALSSLFAYFFEGARWKKVLLFVSSIPIAIITNVCRVVFLAFVSEVWGSKAVEGFVHDASGYAIFIVAFILLAGIGKLLEGQGHA